MGERSLRIVVNGEERSVPAGSTAADLLEGLGMDPRAVVVERNREIISRDELADASLEEGDRLEIVQFVGGG